MTEGNADILTCTKGPAKASWKARARSQSMRRELARISAQVPVIAMILVSLTIVPRPAEAHSSPDTVHQEEAKRVLAAEDEYVAAEVARDEAALRRLVDDRFAFNTNRGTTLGKEELIKRVLAMNMVGQTITERSVLIEGNVALIFGTAELKFANPGKPETVSTLRYTSAFVNRAGQWRMLALQMQERAR